MRKVRKYRSLAAAKARQAELVAALKLPVHYTQKDLDDKIVREVGSGKHVPITKIVKEPVPELLVSPTGKSYAVEEPEGGDAVGEPALVHAVDWEPMEE